MNNTWINHSVYPLLDRIANFQIYFDDMAQILAATCFLMAVGMSCIKIFLQAASAKEQIIKLGMTLVIYLIMLFFYPIVTKAILPFAQNIGYEIIFSSGDYNLELPQNTNSSSSPDKKKFINTKPTKQEFYEWLGSHSGDIFTTSTETDSEGAVRQALEINVVDKTTGRIDLNKTFKYCLAFANAAFMTAPKFRLSVIDALMGLFYLIAMLVGIVCYIVVLINYVMCLLDYYFMIGFGLFFLPLSLWDGSKQYTQSLIGNFVQILVKLMIISTVLFLSIMSLIDMLVEVYLQSTLVGGTVFGSNYGGVLQFCCTLIFQGILLYVLTKETTKIAGMLCGNQPQLSFGEFAHAAVQGAATGYAARGIQKTAGKAALAVASGGSSALLSGLATKQAGGTFKDIARSVGASVGQSTAGSLKSLKENAPSMLQSASNHFSNMTGMGLPGGAEGGTFNPSQLRRNGDNAVQSNGGNGIGSQANSEEKNDLRTGGGETFANSVGSGGMSSRFSKDDYNSPQWTSGNHGVYGKADNRDGSVSGNIRNQLIRGANLKSLNASSLMDYQRGVYQAFGGNVIDAIKQTRQERANGNVSGNGYMKSIMKAGAATMREGVMGLANRGNVFSTDIFDPNGNPKLSAFLGGSGNYVDKNGNYINFMDRDSTSYEKNRVSAGDDNSLEQFMPQIQGPTDNDAVNMAKEATQNAEGNK